MRDVKSKKDLHLEHIIPKKYYTNEYWKSIESNLESTTGDSLNDIKDFIGNMTLLVWKDNTRISNWWFDLKVKEAYLISTFPANQKLALMTKFSISDVKNRQKELGIEALDIWKV